MTVGKFHGRFYVDRMFNAKEIVAWAGLKSIKAEEAK